MNDLMSFGAHRLWKRFFVATSGVREGDVVLDLAGGTGDIAALLLPRVGAKGAVVVGDINAEMLRVGRDRLLDRGKRAWPRLRAARCRSAAVSGQEFDCVTMAFGLRNVTHKERALAEIHRVLKVGGRALILEFSRVRAEILKPLYDFHSFEVLPRLGRLIADDEESYRYLAESIRKHPDQETLKAMMETRRFRARRRAQSVGRHRRDPSRLSHVLPPAAGPSACSVAGGARVLRFRGDDELTAFADLRCGRDRAATALHDVYIRLALSS